MIRTPILLASIIALGLIACTSVPQQTENQRCTDLVGVRMGHAMIEDAEPLRRGEPLVGFFKRTFYRLIIPALPQLKAPVDFCRVTAQLRPVEGSVITAQVWLPQQWNGKLVGAGGGGTNGGLFGAPLSLQSSVKKGYAAVVTDAGHEVSDSARFAYDSQEQFVDWAYRANAVAATFAKDLVANYYGEPARRAYFDGCSNGGRDALMLAQHFPETYDAIISGAPAAAWSELMTSFAWNAQALHGNPGGPKLGDKLELVHSAVINQCDALDGVKDSLLENPLNCAFDPVVLKCAAGEGRGCLTANEVAALQKVYAGPQLSDGTEIYPGMPVGGENEKDWGFWLLSAEQGQAQLGEEVFRWMVHGDKDWELNDFDIDRDYALSQKRMAPITDADDPDLSGFINRGGKLLMYHGWSDAAIPATATVEYYEAARKKLGSAADDTIRLFMVPGMGHCSGGDAPGAFDMLDELDRWVESGIAPERIIGTQYDPPKVFVVAPDAKVVRTRPLCPWTKVARYNGSGSTDNAANFSCK